MIDQDEKLLNKVFKITRSVYRENFLLKKIIKFISFRFPNQKIFRDKNYEGRHLKTI
ncbi:MAG: hypothetical protein Ct9H90mP18_04630 [Gammaproteobacteria bacterium]|nr:MAG: hypothetical protein Ct9H90mP18_04630 [Gammaproteobacteria bacterium]